ncbi:MAG: hypothetical protein ACXVYV_02690 [Gaiellales bacterium]
MRARALIITFLAALVAPAAAHAKGELTSLKVCGRSGCAAVTDPRALRAVGVLGGSSQSTAAPPMGAFYVLKGSMGPGETVTSFYTPGGYTAFEGSFTRVPGPAASVLAVATRHLTGYRVRITAATVDGHASERPAAYAGLFQRLPIARDITGVYSERWVRIMLTADRRNPWTQRTVVYAVRSGLVQGPDVRWYVAPRALAQLIRTDAGLAPRGSSSHGPLIATAVVLLAAGAGAAGLILRRRGAPHRTQVA